jgi:hypothetical protein
MSKTTDREAPRSAKLPETIEIGTIGVQIGDHRVPISGIEHWVEDGIHVFRSTEFDCMGEAEDALEAVNAFVDNAEDLFRFLDDLHDAGRATEDETRLLIKLSRRFFEMYEAIELEREAQSNHRISKLLRLLRQPTPSQPSWQPQQQVPAGYSQPSLV